MYVLAVYTPCSLDNLARTLGEAIPCASGTAVKVCLISKTPNQVSSTNFYNIKPRKACSECCPCEF